jgi:drug/metabolite transporter (DMT)-like permease
LKLKIFFPHLLLIFVNLIYGANFTIAKAIMPKYIPAYGFIFMRVLFALVMYALIYFLFIREPIQKKDWPRFFFCGFFGIAFNQLMFFKGISLTSSINGSLIMITTPIITYFFSQWILKETFKMSKIIGILLGMLGAGILILSSFHSKNASNPLGDMLIWINATSFAIYLIIVRPLMAKYKPLTVIFLCFSTGFIWVFLAGFKEFQSIDWSGIPSIYYFNIGFVLFFATFVVYLFNIMAMNSLSPTVVSSYIYLQPLFAIVFATVYSNENLTYFSVAGGASIIAGLWLINKRKI